jgi:putative ABC transport system permease protein
VIGNVKNVTLSGRAAPEVDVPFSQLPWPSMNLTIRGSADANAIRRMVAEIDPVQPVTDVQSLKDVLAAARAQPRVIMILLAIFSASAFALAVIGLYGVVSYSVAQRRREMGVRIALGASRRDVVGLVVGQGLALAAAGVAGGIGVAMIATRWMATLLYGVSATDPVTFLLSPALLFVSAAIASAIPALRATRVDPSDALRAE